MGDFSQKDAKNIKKIIFIKDENFEAFATFKF